MGRGVRSLGTEARQLILKGQTGQFSEDRIAFLRYSIKG
ncbi:hypothetical protein B14911_12822 [Bacillus sp. NRRL B-14911]|nr:hypothetical protein B14911_12822 [Bacillus sp. NRRL B-14911]